MPAMAQGEKRQFSNAAGQVVNKTMELANNKKYATALAELRKLINTPNLNSYERATIYQMIGQYSYELDRTEDAMLAFENAVKTGGLLPDDAANMDVVIAQLTIGNGQYREGAKRLEAFLSAGGEEKSAYVELLVNAWVTAEDYDRALPWAEKWSEAAAPKARKHYDLLNFLYNNLDRSEDQLRLVKDMIDLWPEDKNLWNNWSSILAGSGQEGEAFEVHKMMYQAGLLETESELLKLVQYYSFYDMPFQAAEILEREIAEGRVSTNADTLNQTASLFQQARVSERALPYLEQVAALSPDTEANLKLGEAFIEAGQCANAETSLKAAVTQGYAPGKARMLIGNCYFEQYGKLDRLSCDMTDVERQKAPQTLLRDAALQAFKAVPKFSTEIPNAEKWVQFIETDIQAENRRCHGGSHYIKVELCYQKIKLAYDAAIFTNGFQLEDKSCEKYVAQYDAEFRIGYSKE